MKRDEDILELIKNRRSVRKFQLDREITVETLKSIITAGSFAPSGHNNQPWRFVLVKDKELKSKISKFTNYGSIVNSANALIAVFFHHPDSYDRDKDLMAIGACIQNMLLYITSLGLGSVWLGEILKNKERVRELLNIPPEDELMAVIALGYPAFIPKPTSRKPVEELIINVY